MYWPKFNSEKLMQFSRSPKRTANGVYCFYVRWTKYVGLKIYSNRSARDASLRYQQFAAKHRLAPSVSPKKVNFEVSTIQYRNEAPCLRTEKLYGYWTEHTPRGRRPSWEQVGNLRHELEKIGLFHDDLHFNNVGRKGKKLVCIDFDPGGLYKDKPITHRGDHYSDHCGTCGESL